MTKYIKKGRPESKGTVTKKGYLRIYCKDISKNKMVHRLVWESVNGKIPDGMQIHHKDGDKLNNNIDNLQLVNPLFHKREHSGCELKPDGWYKPCHKCNKMLHETLFYKTKNGWLKSECKECTIKKVVIAKKQKRLLRNLQQKII